MALEFTPIRRDRAEEYQALLAATPVKAADYSFINLWGWAGVYGLRWVFAHGHCLIRQESPFPALWAPVGPWRDISWTRELFPLSRIIRAPETLARELGPALGAEVLESREHWDYLYSVPELVSLSGNRFHKKKNLLNQFTSCTAASTRRSRPTASRRR